MKEIDIQSKVVRAIEAANGVADKLANKYKKGICDLLIKLRGYDALLVEVKLDIRPVIAQRVVIGTTPLQRQFLAKYDDVGMITCVMSFLHSPSRNYQIRNYWVGLFPYYQTEANVDEYSTIRNFNQDVVWYIERYMMVNK